MPNLFLRPSKIWEKWVVSQKKKEKKKEKEKKIVYRF
jgi:hypothetical protein